MKFSVLLFVVYFLNIFAGLVLLLAVADCTLRKNSYKIIFIALTFTRTLNGMLEQGRFYEIKRPID